MTEEPGACPRAFFGGHVALETGRYRAAGKELLPLVSHVFRLPRASLDLPRAGERVKLCLASGQYVAGQVSRYDGLLVLRPARPVRGAAGAPVVLERRVRDQVFWFRESLRSVAPLAVTCAVPVVQREMRVPVVLSVVYQERGRGPVKTRMVDISSRGLCFHAWEPVPQPEEEIDLEFELYPYGEVRVRGVVRQVYGWTPRWPEVGVEFADLSGESQRVLAAFLRAEVPGPSVV